MDKYVPEGFTYVTVSREMKGVDCAVSAERLTKLFTGQ